ncbi:HAMP domain-containing sensor histidine kinase [Oscillospiraceae bacterium MB08-C2-2]|nr:HAMP domain-containing sensor histidine kinase [Oscillospiraceae bacterium MB08-C2-2]
MELDLLQSAKQYTEMYQHFPLPVVLVDTRLAVRWNNHKADEFYPHLTHTEGMGQVFAEINMDILREKLSRDGNYTISGLFPLSDVRLSFSPVWQEKELSGIICMVLGDEVLPDSRQIYLSGQTASSLSNGIRDSIDTIFSVMDIASLKAEMMGADWIKNSFNRITFSSYRILRISNNVSEYAKYRSGLIHMEKRVLDFTSSFHVVSETLKALAEEAGVPVSIHWPVQPELLVQMDMQSFERALFNVVHNSLYYTRPGNRVDIYVRQQENKILITIRDRGIGIPADVLPDVFLPYYSYNKGGVTFNSGIGLGLTLSKLIVENHGGTISISSREEEGTSVDISVPVSENTFDMQIPLHQEDTTLSQAMNRFSPVYVCLSDAALSPYRQKDD